MRARDDRAGLGVPFLSGLHVVVLTACGGSVLPDQRADSTDAAVNGDAVASNLDGVSVSFGVYCCSSPLLPSDLVGNESTATVGSVPNGAPLFPEISGTNISNYVVPANVYVGASSIAIDFLSFSPLSEGAFDGYVFTFSSAAPSPTPSIAGATLDADSSFTKSQVIVTVPNSHTVCINASGISVTPQSVIVVDLVLATPGAR
jgi:hypothetical protein